MTEPAFLKAANVTAKLGGRTVLGPVSFELHSSRLVALVGPNGAGKTTLLRALAGLLPSDGTFTIDGNRVSGLDARERARRIAYLPQGHVMHWPLPARDIVALGRMPHGAADPSRLSAEDTDAVSRAMVATGTVDFADRPVTQLSGGERSRIALARVLATQAPVILADEPTASLDPRFQIEIMRVLRDATRAGALAIVVTHDLGLASRFADDMLVLSQGRLVAQAPPNEAMSDQTLANVFQVSAFRGAYRDGPVIVPWSGL